MERRIGFYICHCGINIAAKVDVAEVSEFIGRQPEVVVARDYKFMCSDPGQEMIADDILNLGLNRVVVASCSPRLHGKTFMGVCRRSGLNPYYFQMASVREQVSWVTRDPDRATAKAKSLSLAAINRVRRHQRLTPKQAAVHPDVLVIGGGIAGIQAALDVAQADRHVYLVERAPTIGGHMLQFDKTFPTLDCAACIGTPKMVDVGQNPNIDLMTYSEVTGVDGYIGNYTVEITQKPRYVVDGRCTGCGECAEVCPVSLPSEWDQGLRPRKAIYRSFPQAVPITFVIDKKDRAPCQTACPAGINVQGYVQLIRMGQYDRAIRSIMDRMPLPGVLGRVCPHPCETYCRRAEVDQAVAIRDLKRFAADAAGDLTFPPAAERDEKVAVIGSGPAGLTAAFFLRRAGFPVTVFEASEALGGMLRLGIPDYRLPPDVLDRDIARILNLGVDVRTNDAFGRDFGLKDLEDRGFRAVFLAVGAHGDFQPALPGRDADGVTGAVSFLRDVNLGRPVAVGTTVAVIGGGNVAVDAARSARRLGAEKVTIVYRRSAEEMPAYAEEIQGALDEGVDIAYQMAPLEVTTENGRAVGLKCVRTELGPPDASGRRRPRPIEGDEHFFPAERIVPAIGQSPQTDWGDQAPGLDLDAKGLIAADPVTGQTSLEHVFAAGDAVSGPATVIEAVGMARRAAEAIERFLDGRDLDQYKSEASATPEQGDWNPVPDDLIHVPRARPDHLDPKTRVAGFDEVESVLSEDAARGEADRCLNCGVCSECGACVDVCEAQAVDHRQTARTTEVQVGSIILATGYDLMDPSPMKPFGYGKHPNVFTSLEFERLNNATGPTSGRILIRDQNGELTRTPRSAAIIHCVGSRDDRYHDYCSRVCCMYALKYGHLIHDKVGGDVRVYDFYIDLRCFGKGYEEFYRRCQEDGIEFIRGKPAEIRTSPDGDLTVIGEDTLLGQPYQIDVDLVILCPAMEARPDAGQVGRMFGVTMGRDGFFLEEHPKLAPLSTSTDGVFLAGTCQAPRDVPDTVAQASGAASKALALGARGVVEIDPTTSYIDPNLCAGCQVCIGLCPYGAIEFDRRRGVSVVNDAVCKGCGSCAGFCPSGAARSRHFLGRQVFAEIDGIFDALWQIEP